jgi:hypothetical protein
MSPTSDLSLRRSPATDHTSTHIHCHAFIKWILCTEILNCVSSLHLRHNLKSEKHLSIHIDIMAGLEGREYGRRDPSRWPCGTLYPQTLALTSPTSGGRSVGKVRSWTKATEF